MKLNADGLIRRMCVSSQTPAERAIQLAVDEVEKIGADPILTDIVTTLGNAREKLADFIEKDMPQGEQK